MTVVEKFTLGEGRSEVQATLWTPTTVACFRQKPDVRIVAIAVNNAADYRTAACLGIDAVLVDSPLQVTMWTKRLRAVDFTLGYEVRSVNAESASKPAVVAESQLAAVHIEEQRLVRLSPDHREYLQRWLR